MTAISGIKMTLCQMPVVAGRPDLNRDYIIREIKAAAARESDLIIFPELAVPGYFIGDLYDDDCFIKDLIICNEQIRAATRDLNITVIFGSITVAATASNEDGRMRKFNTALMVQHGEWLGSAIKTLQPNYRIFNDDRYFYSMRKLHEITLNEAQNSLGESQNNKLTADEYESINPANFADQFLPIRLTTRAGDLDIGMIICEDMWHEDYLFNPSQYLYDNGAQLIVNISASPWSWQKNRKRNQIVKDLLSQAPVPFIYVNNTGVQNNGKNLIVFDGSSTVYADNGEVIFELPPYHAGSKDFDFAVEPQPLINSASERAADDTRELYQALRCAIAGAFQTLPPSRRKVVVGVSGGIDSALTLALYVDILGKENVFAINMPSQFNSTATRAIAEQLSENLGVNYQVIPIQQIVDQLAKLTGSSPDQPGYENIQARVRMEILAARSQDLNGVFSSNWNKVEAAFGYGTLYGDMAGFIAAIGDLIKREVYQLADYLNREIFHREVIPESCLKIAPTAELKANQIDPFDYGHIDRRGYHDEMVRAFTEFRRNPEWFLEQYARHSLESTLMLAPGTLARLFPTTRDFIRDLEHRWQQFHGAYFKRVQSAPVPIVSRRAFGNDLREAILSPHLTQRYHDLKKLLLARYSKRARVAIYGGSFNPVGRHHRRIVERLAELFDKVLIVPCGTRRDKASANILPAQHRKALVEIGFADLPKVEFDFYDLDENLFTPTYLLEERYQTSFANAQRWYVVGGDIIAGGRDLDSEIHRVWKNGTDVWQQLNFYVIVRPGYQVVKGDLPPSAEILEIDNLIGSGSMIRARIADHQPIDDLVSNQVADYIYQHKLYR